MMRSANAGLTYEDPLTYLPRKPVQEYAKGRVIYDAQHPPSDLYVVILGRVKISNTAEDGCQTVGRHCSRGRSFWRIVPNRTFEPQRNGESRWIMSR